MEKGTVCNSCGLIKPETFRCSGCKAIRYCSKECQKDDWLEHKDFCKSLRTSSNGNLVSVAQNIAELNVPILLYRILSSMKGELTLETLINDTYGIVLEVTRSQVEEFNKNDVTPVLPRKKLHFLIKTK